MPRSAQLFFLLSIGSLGPTLWAAEAVPPVVGDVLTMPAPGSVQMQGWLGREIEICRQGRMLAQSIPDLVRPFATRPEDRMWQTEFWGKWFTSAVLAYRYRPDAAMRAVVDQAVNDLLATQTPDGYIGTYKKEAELKGWDVWGRKYTLLGLLAYYDLTGEARVLEAARRHADYTLTQIGPGKADIATLGMWTGMAASSILEPMVLLYRRTGEKRYLDFAQWIVAQWEGPKGPDLLRKALAKTAVFDMFPGPDPSKKGYMAGGMSKAYEMMSCYEGLLELYRSTGQAPYRQAAEWVAGNISDTEITAIGSGSSWERWCRGRTRQTEDVPEWMETCVGVTWLKLNAQLLRLTGEPVYADRIELSAYNSLLAAQKTDGTWWCHYNPLEGSRLPAPEQCNMHANCCVANGPRALNLLPALAVMTDAQGPVVNLYEAGTATVDLPSGQKITLKIEGDYPRSGVVEIAPQCPGTQPFALALRIPGWSQATDVRVNGQPQPDVRPGAYLRLTRAWKTGDGLRVAFDFAARRIRDPGQSTRVAIQRGPLVFAVERRALAAQSIGPATIPADADGRVQAVKVEDALAGVCQVAIDVPLTSADGRRGTLRMIDCASAGHTWAEDSLFRVWLPQPLDPSDPLSGVAPSKAKH